MDKFVTIQEVNIDNKHDNENIDLLSNYDKDIIVDKKEIKMIREFIEKKMNNTQKIQIVEIIKESNSKYTMNKNGYFINMNNIPMDTLVKIKMFVDFTKENARELLKTEEILNEEKSRIESFDKVDDETNNFSIMNNSLESENTLDKNNNIDIYNFDSYQNFLFEEYKVDNSEEIEFMDRMTESDKRENSGYKIILKRYKKKYFGSKAKILKKFRDISRNSINSKSAKTSLSQNQTKPVPKQKTKKTVEKQVKLDETANQEETQTNAENEDEYTVEGDEYDDEETGLNVVVEEE